MGIIIFEILEISVYPYGRLFSKSQIYAAFHCAVVLFQPVRQIGVVVRRLVFHKTGAISVSEIIEIESGIIAQVAFSIVLPLQVGIKFVYGLFLVLRGQIEWVERLISQLSPSSVIVEFFVVVACVGVEDAFLEAVAEIET